MKRLSTPRRAALCLALAAALCLLLAACRSAQGEPNVPDAPNTPPDATAPAAQDAPPSEPLRLDELNAEFVVESGRLLGDGDAEALLAMKKDFPRALCDALSAQRVEVGSVAVTFGTSGEATEIALRDGAVQLAFLPAEDYYLYRGGMVVAVERGETPDPALGLAVCAVSDDAEQDERFAQALRAALPELADVLAPYTGEVARGRYEYDEERIEQLAKLCEEAAAEN